MTQPKILFQGEMQLARWSESSQNGAMVTFWIHPDDLESFKHLKARAGKNAGQRLGVVVVEIADDEAIVPAAPPAPAPTAYPKARVGKVAMLAVGYCNNPDFQRWAASQIDGSDEAGPEVCKTFILETCGIFAKHGEKASRKHLDTDGEAATLFEQKIRRPYVEWVATQEGFR